MGLFSFLTCTNSLRENERAWSFLIGFGGPPAKSREYLQSYTRWIYACTSAIADEMATIGLRLQKNNGDTWEDVRSHPARDLLSQVNPCVSYHPHSRRKLALNLQQC